MADGCFGSIIYRLIDWNVDDMSRDARRDDEISKALFLEDRTGVFGTIEDTINYSTNAVNIVIVDLDHCALTVDRC